MGNLSSTELEALIKKCLGSFYSRRTEALDKLDLNRVLTRKNPYLFRANGIGSAHEMIKELLAAHISSSDETMFGEEFFEPICKAVIPGQIALAKGADFGVELDDALEAISLKSGPNAFNSDQVSKQNDRFEEMRRTLLATLRSVRKQFIPVMGCGYGRTDSAPTPKRRYYKKAGQAFWEHITGDPDFYLKLVRLMKDDPDHHRPAFEAAWNRAMNRFAGEFATRFCDSKGNILWEALVKFNSGRPETKGKSRTRSSQGRKR